MPEDPDELDQAIEARVAAMDSDQFAELVARTRPPDDPMYPASWHVPGRNSRR